MTKQEAITIGGVRFRFKDLTLDESSEAGEILSGSIAAGTEINLTINNEQLKIFMSKVLIDENGVSYEPRFFGAVRETEAAKIISSFFLSRFNRTIESSKQLTKLMGELME